MKFTPNSISNIFIGSLLVKRERERAKETVGREKKGSIEIKAFTRVRFSMEDCRKRESTIGVKYERAAERAGGAWRRKGIMEEGTKHFPHLHDRKR